MTSKYPETPELEKLRAVRDRSQSIGEFLGWCEAREIVLAKYTDTDDDDDDGLVRWEGSVMTLLAEFFEIDLTKVEEERQTLLSWAQRKKDP